MGNAENTLVSEASTDLLREELALREGREAKINNLGNLNQINHAQLQIRYNQTRLVEFFHKGERLTSTRFGKASLIELIDRLQKIHDLM